MMRRNRPGGRGNGSVCPEPAHAGFRRLRVLCLTLLPYLNSMQTRSSVYKGSEVVGGYRW